jgi:hypothetical protein
LSIGSGTDTVNEELERDAEVSLEIKLGEINTYERTRG